MSSIETIVFSALLTLGITIFILSVVRLIRFIKLGREEKRVKGDILKRILDTIFHVLGQRCAWAEPFGINHLFLFWGFIILLLANAEFIISGLFPEFSFHIFGPKVYGLLTWLFDIVSLIVLLCVIIALFRRVVIRPSHIDYKSKDAFFILGLVFSLMVFFFGLHGAEISQGKLREGFSMPFTENFVSPIVKVLFGNYLEAAERFFFWAHSIIFLFFLNYLPFSKHLHILTSIPNIFLRSFSIVNTVPREEFKRGKTFGVSVVDEFTWKDLLDFTSCTECGRCSSNCPATLTQKPLNPRLVIRDGKLNLFENGYKLIYGNRERGLIPLIGSSNEVPGTIGEEAIWACTTCGACMASCPVFIEHVPKIVKMRRHLVENLAKFPHELIVLFEGMEQRYNPWGMIPTDRSKWAKGLEIPLVSESADFEYLFYVGCAGCFDSRNKKVAVSVAQILKHAGVRFAILGNEEKCCGDSARRLGNEYLFEKLAKQNVEVFEKYRIRKIICYCPHCYSTLKNDYRDYGLDLEVFHISEFLSWLIRRGEIKPKRLELGRVIYHDSCYLGRLNGIFDQPRIILESITGKRPIEMDRMLKKSFCCGAGGGRMWMEESHGIRINLARTKEALSKNPDVIAVSCPYCMTMFEDGLKDLKASEKVRVLDVAEIVSESLK